MEHDLTKTTAWMVASALAIATMGAGCAGYGGYQGAANLQTAPLPVKPATATMQRFTFLVSAREFFDLPDPMCALRKQREPEKVCVPLSDTPRYADWVADALRRAGFGVVRDRMAPYDLEIVAFAGVAQPGSYGDPYVSESGSHSWPSDNGNDLAVYTYSVSLGAPKVTTGLRKNDSGGWRRRFNPNDPRPDHMIVHCNTYMPEAGGLTNLMMDDPQSLVVLAQLSGCFSGHELDLGRTLAEGQNPQSASAYDASHLATCDALETFATTLLNEAAKPTPPPEPPIEVRCGAAPQAQPQLRPPPTPAQVAASDSLNNCVSGCNAQTQACYMRANGKMNSCQSRCPSDNFYAHSSCETACTGASKSGQP